MNFQNENSSEYKEIPIKLKDEILGESGWQNKENVVMKSPRKDKCRKRWISLEMNVCVL